MARSQPCSPSAPAPVVGIGGAVAGQRLRQDVRADVDLAGHVVVPAQRHGQLERELGVVAGERRLERGVEVAALAPHPGEPLGLVVPDEPEASRAHEVGEVLGVPDEHAFALARRGELLCGVVAERLQHRPPRPTCRVLGHDERLVDQPPDDAVDLVGTDDQTIGRGAAAGADGGLGRRPAREHRQPTEHDPLLRREQVVTPVDHGPERLLARFDRARSARQHGEPVVEAIDEVVDRRRAQPCGRQLDRQREPVEPRAELHQSLGRSVIERRACRVGAGPLDEQLDRIGLRQRREGEGELTGDRERLATRGEDADVGAPDEDPVHDGCSVGHDVLAVVDHQQQIGVDERVDHTVDRVDHRARSRRRLLDVGQPDRPGERPHRCVAVAVRCELDERRPVAATCELERGRGLADPTWPEQGDEPVGGDECGQLVDLGRAPDERREPGREGASGGQGRRRFDGDRGAAGRRDVVGAVEDLAFERLQLGTGFEPQILGQPGAGGLIQPQRCRLVARAVVGDHLQRPPAFVVRVGSAQRHQLRAAPRRDRHRAPSTRVGGPGRRRRSRRRAAGHRPRSVPRRARRAARPARGPRPRPRPRARGAARARRGRCRRRRAACSARGRARRRPARSPCAASTAPPGARSPTGRRRATAVRPDRRPADRRVEPRRALPGRGAAAPAAA